jgi:hypothetical protein
MFVTTTHLTRFKEIAKRASLFVVWLHRDRTILVKYFKLNAYSTSLKSAVNYSSLTM